MPARVIDQGRFELRETRDGHCVLELGGDRVFIWLRLPSRALLILRKPGFAPARTLTRGDFVLAAFEDGLPGGEVHLFLQLGAGFAEFVLPAGLPAATSPAVRIVATDEALTRAELWTHLTTPACVRPVEQGRRPRPPPSPAAVRAAAS